MTTKATESLFHSPDAEWLADCRARAERVLAGTQTGQYTKRLMAYDILALLDGIDRLKIRGGIARSLIPAAKVGTFHKRCENLDV